MNPGFGSPGFAVGGGTLPAALRRCAVPAAPPWGGILRGDRAVEPQARGRHVLPRVIDAVAGFPERRFDCAAIRNPFLDGGFGVRRVLMRCRRGAFVRPECRIAAVRHAFLPFGVVRRAVPTAGKCRGGAARNLRSGVCRANPEALPCKRIEELPGDGTRKTGAARSDRSFDPPPLPFLRVRGVLIRRRKFFGACHGLSAGTEGRRFSEILIFIPELHFIFVPLNAKNVFCDHKNK